MTSKIVYKEVDIHIDLEDFTDEELLEELKNRGVVCDDSITDELSEIYDKKRLGQDYEKILSDLIYKILGKII
jgi:uncharacterized protein with ACT and thioredoxin-like domain